MTLIECTNEAFRFICVFGAACVGVAALLSIIINFIFLERWWKIFGAVWVLPALVIIIYIFSNIQKIENIYLIKPKPAVTNQFNLEQP